MAGARYRLCSRRLMAGTGCVVDVLWGQPIKLHDPMIYPNDSIYEPFQMDMTLDKKQATSGAIISYERALWLKQGTGYVVAIMMMMHA